MSYDIIIIGAGSMGMATGYYLTRQNKSVLMIDLYDPPHSEGSYHGETRIIRHAYGEGELYVPLALRAHELWLELEKESKKELFLNTGVLNIGTPNSPFVKNVRNSATRYSLDIEVLNAHEVNNKWKGFQLHDQFIGCYEPKSGVLLSEECVKVFRDLAIVNGASLITKSKVQAIDVGDHEVSIKVNDKVLKGERLIVTAGKGTNNILSMIGTKLPLIPTRKTFSWFNSIEKVYKDKSFPAWTYDFDSKMFYGFPSINRAGVKVGRHDGGYPIPANEVLVGFGEYPEDKQDVSLLMDKIMSNEMTHKLGQVCTYTNTPDGNFIIDRHPNYDNVLVACGFSGHGFKFSSAVGELLSDIVVKGKSEMDISYFSMTRFSSFSEKGS